MVLDPFKFFHPERETQFRTKMVQFFRYMIDNIAEVQVRSNIHFIDLVKGFHRYITGEIFDNTITFIGFRNFLFYVTSKGEFGVQGKS